MIISAGKDLISTSKDLRKNAWPRGPASLAVLQFLR
jgi:hypothetical protein